MSRRCCLLQEKHRAPEQTCAVLILRTRSTCSASRTSRWSSTDRRSRRRRDRSRLTLQLRRPLLLLQLPIRAWQLQRLIRVLLLSTRVSLKPLHVSVSPAQFFAEFLRCSCSCLSSTHTMLRCRRRPSFRQLGSVWSSSRPELPSAALAAGEPPSARSDATTGAGLPRPPLSRLLRPCSLPTREFSSHLLVSLTSVRSRSYRVFCCSSSRKQRSTPKPCDSPPSNVSPRSPRHRRRDRPRTTCTDTTSQCRTCIDASLPPLRSRDVTLVSA